MTFLAFPFSTTEAVTLASLTSSPTFNPSLLTAITESKVTISPASTPSVLNSDYVAFSNFVLFTTCCNNCVHMAPPYQLLARFGGLSTLLPLCAAYFYNISSRLLFVNSIFQEIADFFRMQLPVRQVRCGRQRLRTADAHRLQNPGRLLLLRQSIHRLLLCRLRYRQCEVP